MTLPPWKYFGEHPLETAAYRQLVSFLFLLISFTFIEFVLFVVKWVTRIISGRENFVLLERITQKVLVALSLVPSLASFHHAWIPWGQTLFFQGISLFDNWLVWNQLHIVNRSLSSLSKNPLFVIVFELFHDNTFGKLDIIIFLILFLCALELRIFS